MIRVIFVQKSDVRDTFCRALSLEKKESSPSFDVYQRGEWILVFSPQKALSDVLAEIVESYIPERLFLPFFGKSIDPVHEIGDIVLPNVFLSYDENVGTTSLDKENRDAYMGDAKFLETFAEQKDYYVEDFGFSLGGIVVDRVPVSLDESVHENLMLAYEADVYASENLEDAYVTVTLDEATSLITCGIVDGKMPKNLVENPLDFTVRNMITAWRLLEE